MYHLLNQEYFSNLEREKLKFGIQLILSELYKIILIYSLAYLLDCIVPTLIAHISFFLLRQVCFGYHFSNLYVCIGTSIITFPIAVKLIASYYNMISGTLLYIIFGVSLILIYMLAPKGTEKHPLINQNHKKYLRKKMMFRVFLIFGIFCIVNFDVKVFIAYGVLVETIMLIAQSIKGEFYYEMDEC
ncbi:accessory gene regulator ArgB-like protein [Ureibacillus suwonensis]|uniref:Accessory gene regulator ArgB-like protein n=1 Tax=Ureibacillus suwonensis TaxID=313007 RepID=A0ABW0RES3_9BACL